MPSDDLSISPGLILTGAHEAPLGRYLARTVKKGCRAIDAGARIGYFSVMLARLVGAEGRVIAYEPHPKAFAFLLDNLSINYVRDRVEARRMVVHDEKAEVSLFATARFLGNVDASSHRGVLPALRRRGGRDRYPCAAVVDSD